jgi:hypothetical protein
MSEDVKVPVDVINYCESEALGQVLSWWDDRFSPEQIIRDIRGLGDQIPVIDEWDDLFIVFSGFDDATGNELANQFDEYFQAFLNVAKLAIVRTRVEVQK